MQKFYKVEFYITQIRIKLGTILLKIDTKNGIDIVSVPIKEIELSPNHQFKYTLSIFAIFKDEEKYLEEWIDFHLKQGVAHFYLYDNESSDKSIEILKKYSPETITIYNWPSCFGNGGQTIALAHAISVFKMETEWLLHIDIDEFVFARKNISLIDVINNNSNVACMILNWRCFGPSGHSDAPRGGVLENYLEMADLDYASDKMKYELTRTKALFKAHKIVTVHVHNPEVAGAKINISEQIILNHYVTRSENEFYTKIGRAHPWSNTKLLDSWRKKLIEMFEFLKKYHKPNVEIISRR
jgi:hypothetical protein